MRQGLSAIGPTPSERRVDEGGPAPDLTRGLAGSLQSIAEILGPQADIAAMVDEAKRAERFFTKGDYLDALSSLGLAAIAPAMIATPGSVKNVREVSEEIIPQKIFSKEPDAIGSMTGSTDKYSSVEMIMDKKKFDANVENLPKSQIKKDSVEYLTKALKNNKPVAQPFITLKWDGSTWKPQKGTHEGRHRTIAAEKVFGKGVKFPVNVQLRTKKGSTVPIEELTGRKKFYKVKDQDEADKMLAELEKFNISDVQKKKGGSVIERNPYNYPPRSI